MSEGLAHCPGSHLLLPQAWLRGNWLPLLLLVSLYKLSQLQETVGTTLALGLQSILNPYPGQVDGSLRTTDSTERYVNQES